MNKLEGKIAEVQSSDNISIIKIDVEGDLFSSIILEGERTPLNYKTGDDVSVLFKEAEVGIAKNLTGLISLRNRFKGVIKKVRRAPILAEITLAYRDHEIRSIISTQSADKLALKEGDEVEWLVKSNEVTLMR